jgi:hypothetical protein
MCGTLKGHFPKLGHALYVSSHDSTKTELYEKLKAFKSLTMGNGGKNQETKVLSEVLDHFISLNIQ